MSGLGRGGCFGGRVWCEEEMLPLIMDGEDVTSGENLNGDVGGVATFDFSFLKFHQFNLMDR